VSERDPWVVAGVVLLTIVAVIVFVLAAAMAGVPSEISVPLIVLAAFAVRTFRKRRQRRRLMA
jgi:hypothetical protein